MMNLRIFPPPSPGSTNPGNSHSREPGFAKAHPYHYTKLLARHAAAMGVPGIPCIKEIEYYLTVGDLV
jgi:hypothetical protein